MSLSICGSVLIAILTSDWERRVGVQQGGPAQERKEQHFHSPPCDLWMIRRMDNVCMADITVWVVMCSHTSFSACNSADTHIAVQ